MLRPKARSGDEELDVGNGKPEEHLSFVRRFATGGGFVRVARFTPGEVAEDADRQNADCEKCGQ
jgi:hypothetical protein